MKHEIHAWMPSVSSRQLKCIHYYFQLWPEIHQTIPAVVVLWQRRIIFEAETMLWDDIINRHNKLNRVILIREKALLLDYNYFCSLICAYFCTIQPCFVYCCTIQLYLCWLYSNNPICSYCYTPQPYLQTYTLWSAQKLVPCVTWRCDESTDELYHLICHHTAFLWEEQSVHPSRSTSGPWYDVDWSLQLEDPVSWAWMCLKKIFQSLNTGVHNDLLKWVWDLRCS